MRAKAHYDYFWHREGIANGGNRYATVLSFLVDTEEGGETVRGQRGWWKAPQAPHLAAPSQTGKSYAVEQLCMLAVAVARRCSPTCPRPAATTAPSSASARATTWPSSQRREWVSGPGGGQEEREGLPAFAPLDTHRVTPSPPLRMPCCAAVLFHSIKPNGDLERKSMHTACPVIRG